MDNGHKSFTKEVQPVSSHGGKVCTLREKMGNSIVRGYIFTY